MLGRILFDENPIDGGNGGNPPEPTPVPDPTEGFKIAIKKHGDDMAGFARTLHADVETLRRENAELRGKLLKDGDDLASYRELIGAGKPEEIKAKLEAGTVAEKKAADFERKELLTEAALAAGDWNPKVLITLADRDGLTIEIKDGKKLGKDVRIADVVISGKDDKGADVVTRKALEKYAEEKWAEFLPSLRGSKPPAPGGSPPSGFGQPRPAIGPVGERRSLVK